MQLMDTNSPTEHRLNRLPQRLDYTLIPPPLGELEFVYSLFEFCLSPPILRSFKASCRRESCLTSNNRHSLLALRRDGLPHCIPRT